MIRAAFIKSGQELKGFSISGHAGYDEYGKDIACASVTSAVQLTVNAITEVLTVKAKLEVEENTIKLRLPTNSDARAPVFLEALLLHLNLLAEEFEGALEVKVSEVL